MSACLLCFFTDIAATAIFLNCRQVSFPKSQISMFNLQCHFHHPIFTNAVQLLVNEQYSKFGFHAWMMTLSLTSPFLQHSQTYDLLKPWLWIWHVKSRFLLYAIVANVDWVSAFILDWSQVLPTTGVNAAHWHLPSCSCQVYLYAKDFHKLSAKGTDHDVSCDFHRCLSIH